jgi:hypothetical protein
MMQSSLPGVACVIEPSNNSGVAASQNASIGKSAGSLANFFRFQIIGARLACLFSDDLGLLLPCLRRQPSSE